MTWFPRVDSVPVSLRKCRFSESSSDAIAFFRDPATLDLDGDPPVLGVGDRIAPLAAACAGVGTSRAVKQGWDVIRSVSSDRLAGRTAASF